MPQAANTGGGRFEGQAKDGQRAIGFVGLRVDTFVQACIMYFWEIGTGKALIDLDRECEADVTSNFAISLLVQLHHTLAVIHSVDDDSKN